MNCTNFTEGVESLLDGLLPAAEGQALRAHAASCATCGDELRCAEKFRALLAADGQSAMIAAADREAASAARAEAVAGSRTIRPAWFRFAAAAVVVAAFGAGAFVSRTAAPAAEQVATGSVELVRGERRILGEGRTVVADDPTALDVIDGANVRLRAGSAMFQVEHGKPFSVVTEQGTVEVRGTLFHVAQRANRSVSVGVSSGVVAFHPVAGGAVRTLTAGEFLQVSASGEQQFVSRDHLTAAEARLAAQRQDLDELRAALAKKDGEIAALRDQVAVAASVQAAAPDPDAVWRELGAATCDMLIDPSPDSTPEPVKQSIAALEKIQKHLDVLREVSGSTRLSAFEAPSHPAVIARTADGFVQALAPLVSEADRKLAAAGIRAAATEALQAMSASTTQAEVSAAQLTMYGRIAVALRDHLGAVSAARLARTSILLAEGLPIRVAAEGEAGRRQFQDVWLRRLGQGEEDRAAIDTVIVNWISATKAVQASILAEWGDASGRGLLFPEERSWGARAADTSGVRTSQIDDDQAVALLLRRIDAKKRLLVPRVELERTLLSRVDAEQAATARADLFSFITLWTFR